MTNEHILGERYKEWINRRYTGASRILTDVFGATGQQGGQLLNHILNDSHLSSLFKLRGVTRDASKPAAVALKDRGVEIVEADLNVRSSLEQAVTGSYAVFAVTQFWEKASAEVEIAQGKAIADAAVAAGVSQIIWSSLPGGPKDSAGKFTGFEHFASKAVVEEYIRTLNIKSTFFMAGWYMQNHLSMMRPQKLEDGTYEITEPWPPSTKVPLIDIRDTGKYVTPALLDPDRFHGTRLSCATAYYTFVEMAHTWTKVTGKVVNFCQDTADEDEVLQEQKKKLAEERDMFNNYGYFGPKGEDDVAWTRQQVTGKLGTWEEFVRDNEPWFM